MNEQWVVYWPFKDEHYGSFDSERQARDYAYREMMWDVKVYRLVKPV